MRGIPCCTFPLEGRVCVRVCVCVCERERERERRQCVFHSDHLNASKMTMTANLIACVTSDRRKKTAAKDTTSLAGNLPLYPLQMAHR